VELYITQTPSHDGIPLLVDLPHSGVYVPPVIAKRFKPGAVLSNSDWHLEKLYSFLPELGVTVLQATHNRYVVDLNREAREPLFGPYQMSVVYATNTWGSPLYDTPLTQDEIQARIRDYYLPYHREFEELLNQMVQKYGKVYLLDLHSFCFHDPRKDWPDVCLGNVNGTTSSASFIGSFQKAFQQCGFDVSCNEMLTGGYITRHYGSLKDVESLQIELRYPVYLDRERFVEEEVREWDSERFRKAQERLKQVFHQAIEEILDR
jgi:N-formylglutamate deformylase